MKTSVETINGVLCTVIWHKDSYAGARPCGSFKEIARQANGSISIWDDTSRQSHIATALPPLPRNPTPDDARLLREYLAKDITPVLSCESQNFNLVGVDKNGNAYYEDLDGQYQATHLSLCELYYAINSETGECVEVAIKEGKTND